MRYETVRDHLRSTERFAKIFALLNVVTSGQQIGMAICGVMVCIAGFEIAAMTILIAAILTPFAAAVFRHLSFQLFGKLMDTWAQQYRRFRWETSCEEKVSIVGATYDGRFVSVRYEDGDLQMYPAWLLKPLAEVSAAKAMQPRLENNLYDRAFDRQFRTAWLTHSGEVAIVRRVNAVKSGGQLCEVQVKLPSGRHVIMLESQLNAYDP